MVNAHTHVYSGLVPLGMPAPDVAPASFVEILERVWWRLDRALDAPTLRAAARVYVAEALLHGTTALVDHHESPCFIEGSLDVIADACQDLGMRAALCYGATERNGGRDEARRGLAECRRFITSNRRPLVRGLVGLHASFTVSDDTVREAGELCRELGTVLHVHVAEDRADVDDARRRRYAGPLERLEALGALPWGSILAHGVHLDAAQVRHAGSRGWWIVQNPRSNRNNGVGYPAALGESPRVALGTDGFLSDMVEEAAALGAEAAAHGERPDVAEARAAGGAALAAEVFGAAAIAGAPPDPGTWQRQLENIRVEAAEAAAALWKRMAAV
jgi:cytosine/adenosine deaminase-related metal-dependent hydrolase